MIVSGRVRFHPDLEPLLRPIGTILPHPDNYNNGDVDAIGESVDLNGMCDVVLVQASTGYIISGTHTYYALLERDSALCPYVLLDVDDLHAKRIMVAMDAIPRLARPDKAGLLRLVHDIEERDSLRGIGVTTHDREALEKLAEMVPVFERTDWPMLTLRVSPHMLKAFRYATREADTNTDRFELLLRLAGAM
jgi:hypothetical protein